MEPRAATPQRRLETVRQLSEAGIPVCVLVAPVIPALTDTELETILEQAKQAGAQHAGYVLLRLPHELKEMFQDWLHTHEPLKEKHVLNLIRSTRDGNLYDNRFGARMRGTGEYATLIRKRFDLARKHLGYHPAPELDCSRFTPPASTPQISLF
jgi:DNA repair photolyase